MTNLWNFDFQKHVLYHKKPTFVWDLLSGSVCTTYMLLGKFVGRVINTSYSHNVPAFNAAIEERGQRGLLTVSNHACRVDDPLLFHVLKMRHVWNLRRFRYSTAAEDVCFTHPFHAFCMAVGRILPVQRGLGVMQEQMRFCVQQLEEGNWIHIFPEGRIQLEEDKLKPVKLKWGVGRLIHEPETTPLVLLIHHMGFDTVIPNDPSIYPRVGNKISVYVDEPIDFTDSVKKMKAEMKTPEEMRIYFTSVIRDRMEQLKQKAEQFHLENTQKNSTVEKQQIS